MTKRLTAALLCIMLAAGLCSCGAEESSSAADTTTTTVTASGSAETVTETVTATAAPQTSAAESSEQTSAETSSETEASPSQTEAQKETVTASLTQTETTTETTTVSETVSKKPEQTVSETTASVKETEPPKPAFSEGTYKGSFGKYIEAMNADVRYDVTVKFAGGSYDYTVEITLSGGMEHHATENYTGTYTVEGETLTLTGQLKSGRLKKDGIELTGELSGFASEAESLTVRK